jgi:hypothetical protein
MGARRIRREQRQVDMARSRIVNGHKKKAERVRREARMVELLKKSKLPYTPSLMSWVSEQLNKPSTRITQEEIDRLVQTAGK